MNIYKEKPMKKISVCPTPIGRVLRHGKFYNVACKSWLCPHCSRVKKYRMGMRFENHKGSFRYRMLTLTEWKNPKNIENALMITHHWNRLRASLRKHGYHMKDYMWTKEYKPLYGDTDKHAVKYPHLHILIPSYIPVGLIRRLWFLATNQTADMVHIPDDDEVVIGNPVAYMMKYLMKSDMNDGFHKKERRFSYSRKYPVREVQWESDYDENGEIVMNTTYKPLEEGGVFIPRQWVLSDQELIGSEEELFYNAQVAKEAHREEKCLSIQIAKYASEVKNNVRNV